MNRNSASAKAARKPPVIRVALANDANARLLYNLLGKQFDIRRGLDNIIEVPGMRSEADLILVDAASLEKNRDLLRKLRRRIEPVTLPVLLVLDNRTGLQGLIAASPGQLVDDVLRIPTNQTELTMRLNTLLHLRELSISQEEDRQQLVGVVSSLRTLSACDQVVVRSTTEQELIRALCRTIVNEEGYSLAWIGFALGNTASPVEIHASAGPAAAFIPELALGWEHEPQPQGPASRTLRTGQTQVISDIAKELPPSYVRDKALKHHLAAVITLPVKVDTGPPGCLAIYSDKPGHFGTEERQLLERLADNLAFGLNALRVQRERAQQASEIHYLAYTDALTGLPNRRHLIHYLDGKFSHLNVTNLTGAILFIDLDGFKLINDALGHDVGDQVLKQISQRLTGSVRDHDLVVRQGGDEFLVVMVDEPRNGGNESIETLIESAHTLARRIIDHLSEPLMAGGYTHRVKASIGISLYPAHGTEAVVLVENADKAMYEAKKRGGGRSHLFSEGLSVNWQKRFSLESRLREALVHQAFELYYQPVFDLHTSQIVAVEALIRWPQSDGEILMPGAFMPLAEETGLIRPLGDWVLETAARQLRAWHDKGFTLAMAVNLSINQLYPDGDAEHFAALVRPHVDPLWMHLEVTENALMADPVAIEQLLSELHAKGFQLAIDDFGTGYSSLSRLQHLSIQTLKIDRSFVSELDKAESKGSSLVPTIQQMASNLKLLTIAEGIETDEQRQALLSTSAELAWGQGYWFSPAVPARELEAMLRAEAKAGP